MELLDLRLVARIGGLVGDGFAERISPNRYRSTDTHSTGSAWMSSSLTPPGFTPVAREGAYQPPVTHGLPATSRSPRSALCRMDVPWVVGFPASSSMKLRTQDKRTVTPSEPGVAPRCGVRCLARCAEAKP